MSDDSKLGFFGYIKPLFCDNGSGLSLGRISFWLTFVPALNIWWEGNDIKENHLYILGFLLIYNSYKKIPQFIDLIHAWRGTSGSS